MHTPSIEDLDPSLFIEKSLRCLDRAGCGKPSIFTVPAGPVRGLPIRAWVLCARGMLFVADSPETAWDVYMHHLSDAILGSASHATH